MVYIPSIRAFMLLGILCLPALAYAQKGNVQEHRGERIFVRDDSRARGLMNRKLLHLFFALALLLSSCAKEFTELNLPKIVTVSTSPASSITLTTATIGGNVSSAEQHPITSRGIVYGRAQNPTFADSSALSGSGSGVFSTTLSGLAPSTRYYARAFATVDLGTAYGNEVGFTTLAKSTAPTVATTSVTAITASGGVSGGIVTSDGGASVVSRGVAYGLGQNPLITGSVTSDGNGIGAFVSNLTGLASSTIYYVRAYATNSVGTSYGDEVNFLTSAITPTITTSVVTGITSSGATSGGNVTSDGGSTVTARGVAYGTSLNPSTSGNITRNGTGTGAFNSTISGLTGSTIYYVRSYATNGVGTAYGNQVSFTTSIPETLPVVTTSVVTNITSSSATSGGNVTSSGNSFVSQRGVCFSTSQNPTTTSSNLTSNGSGTGSYTSTLYSLNANTTYYLRAFATNTIGTAYGSQISFTTSAPTPNLVFVNSCTSLSGITSSYQYWNGTANTSTAWTISNNGHLGTCWAADMTGVSGTGPVGVHFVQFTRSFGNNGFITFWLKTHNPGYNNVFPTVYIDGVAQSTPTMTGGQISSFYFMRVQSANISAGFHTIKIEFTCNYRDIYVDEIEFYEY